MGGLAMIGAIAFDPTVRGILVVVTGTTVLMGSIFMILSTNSGVRVGALIALSALFGWMTLMGSVWVIYGIGLKGRDPAWMPTDVNYSRDTPITGVPEMAKLPAEEKLPDPEALLESKPLLHALALGSEGATYKPVTLTKLKTVIQPLVTISPLNLAPTLPKAKKEAADILADNPDVAALIDAGGEKLSKVVHQQADQLREEIEAPLGGWCLLTESDPRRGEAQASADAELIAAKAFGDATTSANYIVKDVFFYGGKEPCNPITEQDSFQQAWHRIHNTFEIKNPPLLAAVTVVKTIDFPAIDGQAPPPATAEPRASDVTVVMLRNLGNKRFIPFMFALANLIGFVVVTTMLHYRDKQAMAVRAAFSGAGKGK
ncbi:MAG: hypothetical protein U0Q22_02050 [Acidimicrobiales bacterium]